MKRAEKIQRKKNDFIIDQRKANQFKKNFNWSEEDLERISNKATSHKEVNKIYKACEQLSQMKILNATYA